ncbi:hypothetical protein TWF970_007122 [Orbilia oligospora]|uniref:Uncharacterized protein n=1 Tax=Orbilia oligospora TaxID=2813651 RepID=A0A7C8RI80_ORBOL|nr:hypothetical protein TWF970_007122 [Orbilia oligospora]
MDASEQERFQLYWARELRAAPAIIEILAIWNAYALRDDVIAIELQPTHTRVNPDEPVKGLLATSVSLSHKGRRAFQQAQSDGETFLQVVNELSKTKSYVFKLAGGFGVEDVLVRQYQQALRILCRETFPRLKDKGGKTLSAFEDLACEIETGIEAVARALGIISNSRDGVWSLATYIWGGRWKGVGGWKRYPKWCRFAQQEDEATKYSQRYPQRTNQPTKQCLYPHQLLQIFILQCHRAVQEISKYEADIKITTEDDTIAMLSTQAADSIHRELAISRVPVATKLKAYIDISYTHIIPGLEKIEGIATLDSGKAGLNKQTQLALEQMAKYRCDAQEAIDELITNRKLQLWDQLKATGYKLSDASPLNPRRRAATDRAGENAREIFGDL